MAGRKGKTGLESNSGGPSTGINNGRIAYTAANSKVMAEAKKRKRGGRAEYKVGGAVAAPRMDKRARGGGVNATSSPFSSAGGGGATKSPFSSAARGR